MDKVDTTGISVNPVPQQEDDEKNVGHEEPPKPHYDADAAAHEIGYELYKEGEAFTYTPQQDKKVRIKIDWIIMPMFCITQGLSFMDKTALNYGNLFGLQKYQHINTNQVSWYASAFYLAYMVFAWPMNVVLQKYPTGKVMGVVCVFWGIVCATFAACKDFTSGVISRTILGALEAAVSPGLGLMTPLWYKLDEVPLRHLTWWCFNGVSSIFGSLIAYGLGHVTSTKVPSWALIFIVFGVVTSLWGFVMIFFLPDSPASARWLNKEEKIIAVKRVAESRTGIKNTVFKWEQVFEAFRDPKLYLLFIASIAAQIPNGVGSNFSSVIIESFGFDQLEVTLLGIPSSVLQIISLTVSGWVAGRFKNSRVITMFVGNVACIISSACLTYAPKDQRWGRLVAFWFTNFQSVGFTLSLVMISANVGGYTKRQTMNAVTFIAYCVGNIIGPFTIKQSEAKRSYPTATTAMMISYVVKTVTHVLLGVYMLYWNKKWDRLARERDEVLPSEERRKRAEEFGMNDVTEFNNPYFRYVL